MRMEREEKRVRLNGWRYRKEEKRLTFCVEEEEKKIGVCGVKFYAVKQTGKANERATNFEPLNG